MNKINFQIKRAEIYNWGDWTSTTWMPEPKTLVVLIKAKFWKIYHAGYLNRKQHG